VERGGFRWFRHLAYFVNRTGPTGDSCSRGDLNVYELEAFAKVPRCRGKPLASSAASGLVWPRLVWLGPAASRRMHAFVQFSSPSFSAHSSRWPS
jgi:hypothetical protein